MIKSLKRDKIGSVHRKKHNGMPFTVTITDNPSNFQFYTELGLDVFEYKPTANVEVKKVTDDSTGKSNNKPKRRNSANG